MTKEEMIREQYVNAYFGKLKKTIDTIERDTLIDTIIRLDNEIKYLHEALEEEKKHKRYYESMYKAMREIADMKGF